MKNPIPERLRKKRLEFGFTQEALGIAAGIDEFSARARMNQYENGKRVPNFKTLFKISTVLRIPVAYFYADEQLAELIEAYHKLSNRKKKDLIMQIYKLL